MIYIENKDGVQRVVIPTNDTNVEYVNFVPQEGDFDYYTKAQTDEKIAQSRTSVLGEVGDWLSHYPTTDQMHDAIEEADYATLDDLRGLATIVNNNDMKLSQTRLVTTSGEDMCETNLVTGPSGTYIPFKTINGESIVGPGDVEVGADGGYLFRATEYSDRSTPSAVELADGSLAELFDNLKNNRNVNVSLFVYDYVTVNMQGCECGDDYCTIYFQEPTQFVLVTFNATEVQDVTCVPISDIHGPSSVIINLSGNMNLPVDAFNRLHNAHKDGTSGIIIQNNTVHSVVGSTDDSITLMGKDSLVIYADTNGVITKTTMVLADKEYVDEAIANMPSGGGSGDFLGYTIYIDEMSNGFPTNKFLEAYERYASGLPVMITKGIITASDISMWKYDGENGYTICVTVAICNSEGGPQYEWYGWSQTFDYNTGDYIDQGYSYYNNGELYTVPQGHTFFNPTDTGGSGGGSMDENPVVNSLTVLGGANFTGYVNMQGELGFNSPEIGFDDITSGLLCNTKLQRAQATNLFVRNIYAGLDYEPITFGVYDLETGVMEEQLARIDRNGNIYEGTTKLSDKYATIDYVDTMIGDINNLLSNI